MRNFRTPILALLFSVMLFISFTSTISCVSNPARQAGNTAEPGDHNFKISLDGRNRFYVLHIPPAHDGKTQLPLVFVLHGGAGNANHAMKTTEFSRTADAEGFYVVYPEGTGALRTWNAGRCCAHAMDNDVDDSGFIRALIAKLETELPVDRDRIYAAGFSNGGMMAHKLGCDLADLLAAIAPVSGSLEFKESCEPAQPISVIMIHGTEDRNVPYNGGRGAKALVKLEKRSVKFAFDFWSRKNNCKTELETPGANENITKYNFSDCDSNSEVTLYRIEGGAHAWPGRKKLFALEDTPTNTLSATKEIWTFFKSHPKTPKPE